MLGDDFTRIDALLVAALDLPPAERDAYLEGACGGDALLARRVKEMIRLAEADDGVLSPGGAYAPEDVERATHAPGSRLGPYEVRGLLGKGGMGRVYRALDPALGREVAIKALPSGSHDPSTLKRFEREARLLASLSHPNVASIYGFEILDGAPFLVLELVDGETLAERLKKGPLPVASAISIAAQIADGLGEAHGKGVVHRDLKPSNVMIADGRVKIVDFGLAKPAGPHGDAATHLTAIGTVVGTAPYMAPEQVQGGDVDARTDVWAFGCVLYEMLASRQAFRGRTATDVLTSVLRDEPDFGALPATVPGALLRLVKRCLKKDPRQRLQHVGDARLDLEDAEAEAKAMRLSGAAAAAPDASPARARRAWAWPALALAVLAGAAAGWLARGAGKPISPRFTRVTFRRGYVREARFAPDGGLLFAAAWDGEPLRVYRKRDDAHDPAPLEVPAANLLAVSGAGDLALSLGCEGTHSGVCRGTLARASAAEAGAPHEIAEGIQQADFTDGGTSFVVVRDIPGGASLEAPPGHRLHVTAGHFSFPRVAPSGDRVAFLEHPNGGDDRGSVMLADFAGKTRRLTPEWRSVRGLAWSPNGEEVWFTAAGDDDALALRAVTLSGRVRTVHAASGDLTLHDVAKDGRVLLAREEQHYGIAGRARGEGTERELSWLDHSVASGMSEDGETLLLTEQSQGVGARYAACLRRMDGSSLARKGEGWAMSLSPDGATLLTKVPSPGAPLVVTPLRGGEARTIAPPGLECHWATFLPDGRRILAFANEPGHRIRLYIVSDGGRWTARTEEGAIQSAVAVAPDGHFAAWGADHRLMLWPLEDGPPTPLAGARLGDVPIAFVDRGRALLVSEPQRVPRRLFRIDLASGARTPWRELMPAERAGVADVLGVVVSGDGAAYAYTYQRWLSELYVVSGLR